MSKTEKSELNRTRGGRLARRARSFKEDFLGRLNQMRSPSGTRAGSPCKGLKNKGKGAAADSFQDQTESSRSVKDVENILHSVRLLSSALRYFQDVVQKNTLEMLPGSATVVLEMVLTIHSILRESFVNEQSSLMLSASNQVYQSLANLIKWSDCVLLYGDKAIEKENVIEIVDAVQEAIKTLVQLSIDRLQNKDNKAAAVSPGNQNGVYSPSTAESPHRGSLPDISLTPRERELLEQAQFTTALQNKSQLHHSASSDSILGVQNHTPVDVGKPPPKPPLPEFRAVNLHQSPENRPSHGNKFHLESAPPLPPKKKSGQVSQSSLDQGSVTSASDSTLLNGSFGSLNAELGHSNVAEWTSPLSQSPESSTPLSKSSASSLDSNLNHSADDISFGTQTKLMHHSHTHFDSCYEHTFFSTSSSQTYSCELASYSSKMATTTTSISLHSGDTLESMNNLLSTLNHVSTKCEESLNSQSEPPALPAKLRVTRNRTLSQYDNVPQLLVSDIDAPERYQGVSNEGHSPHCPRAHSPQSWPSANNHAPTCPHHQIAGLNGENGKPPPLPPKKKTIMAYMQMFGSYSQPSETEFLRHSLHTYKVVQAEWQQMELSFMQQQSFKTSFISSSEDSVFSDGVFSDGPSSHSSLEKSVGDDEVPSPATTPPALPPKKNRMSTANIPQLRSSDSPTTPTCCPSFHENTSSGAPYSPTLTENDEKSHWSTIHNDGSSHSEIGENGALDELDVSHFLICKQPGEEGPDIRGGTVDSLLVQATKAPNNDFLYQEAFLTTYRTFIPPSELIKKLLYRYNKFIHMSDMRQRAARNAFALLVRVVDDLCIGDLQEEILQVLVDFIFQLVSRGDLLLARALRKKVVEKCEARHRNNASSPVLLPSMAVTTHQASLLDFKSENLAEQMTVLDADLFQKIEIPEVLLWAKEQKEELSPNLTTFTEHFNKMSYWARSRILEQEDAKDRERYVVKFIKIMKHLRKLNNFNSYLAILSALDSAPIRRLEWQRNITEGLKEYCALIDSSSSFRAYRQALAETGPPCIPYIGLILQDLTFVHIGNSDYLPEGTVNFSKRWQQFNILDNMRRFKHCQYPFKRNDQTVSFFNNFDNYLCEEAMWQISETIKPRGGKKKSTDQI